MEEEGWSFFMNFCHKHISRGKCMVVTRDIKYVGVNDYRIDLFEGMYKVPNGMSYNSYVIMDEKIAIMDTVDEVFAEEWLKKLKMVLQNRKPDYLVVQHMEPDHSANITRLLEQYPEVILVASAKAFSMMKNYFGKDFAENRIVVTDKAELSLGKHTLKFITALMVHWPEVIMTYDMTDKVLFTADAFGKFGAVEEGSQMEDLGESEVSYVEKATEEKIEAYENWLDEARRYYFGIVGKYGVSVQKVLEKIKDWEIQMLCPLHGPVITKDLERYVKIYDIWSSYQAEEEGILIAYTSIYGNTKKAVKMLAETLKGMDCPKVVVIDLARCDMSYAVAEAFRYSKLVLATTTYNVGIFPFVREFIDWLVERNFSNRMVAFMENGSWMPVAAKLMREKMDKCKDIVFAENSVKIWSSLDEESLVQLELLVSELCKEYLEQ